jgi:hypothetical protein
VPFKARTPARRHLCARGCGRRATGYHHLLAQQHLRTYVRGLARREGMAPGAVRQRLAALLRDERNLMALCQWCHMAHEHGAGPDRTRLRWEEVARVAPAAEAFAGELGPEWLERLRRAYR